jgi:tetratricopeptide (TPR) repeat protein
LALSQLPAHPDRFRQMEFLRGLQAWRLEQRGRAENHFHRVLATRFTDLADAISAHLTGVAMSKRGDHGNAVTLLLRSVATLRELDDKRGLCQTLISLGIAKREISAMWLSEAADDEMDVNTRVSLMAQADESFRSAQDALDEAAELAHDLQDSHLEAQTHLELAACFERWNDIDAAIEESETARSIMAHDDRAYVRVLTQLGSLYKQNEDYENAGAVLSEAAQTAFALSRENIEEARLLNVQAAYERRRGHLDTAHSYAESSVRIGRKLEDKLHLGHALHTLAAITIDQAQSSANLDDAENLLRESEAALRASHNNVGLKKIEQTREVLKRRRVELKNSSA